MLADIPDRVAGHAGSDREGHVREGEIAGPRRFGGNTSTSAICSSMLLPNSMHSAVLEVSPVALAPATGLEPAAGQPGLGSSREYQLAAIRVDVRASYRLSSLDALNLRFEQPSVFREQALHFVQDAFR